MTALPATGLDHSGGLPDVDPGASLEIGSRRSLPPWKRESPERAGTLAAFIFVGAPLLALGSELGIEVGMSVGTALLSAAAAVQQ